ncbi:MAG: acyl-CoA thioesterase [Rhodopseudomonas sp.]|uniref:GDSL-type esterase/lipase family protein n=1 Tax=Rhodopseudomonas sp. TaxID=1078 RepID=UPI00179473D8|nr:GDSL-type esterase/lipase family protein [Rhodopseudomonas sp.]NVN87759.1 acyl-CoA thioesterase [Rhodopseudomonas sp.]
MRLSALSLIAALAVSVTTPSLAATVVALGASNTFGKGVARSQAYPEQLQAMLRAKGRSVRIVNAGINGDTTDHMLARLDGLLGRDTVAVILQPGGNDRRKGKSDTGANIEAIRAKVSARGIRLIMLPNNMLHGLPHQPDGQHLTPEGYRSLAASLAPEVEAALR